MTTTTPYISIALLTYNAGGLLRRVLEGIRVQECDLSIEVVAIDSGSSDDTVALLREFDVRVIEIPHEEFNFGATREQLYQACQGAYIVNLSQDAVPADPQWLEHLLKPLLEDDQVAVSTGRSIPDFDRDYRQFPWERNGYFYFTRASRRFSERYGTGLSFANSAVRQSVWKELHFDPQVISEDLQFQVKLHATDYTRAYPDDAPVLHHHDYTVKSLYTRCRNEGHGLRIMGCAYPEWDLLCDLISPKKYLQWLREIKYRRMKTPADALFPILRPIAVYIGSRFSKG